MSYLRDRENSWWERPPVSYPLSTMMPWQKCIQPWNMFPGEWVGIIPGISTSKFSTFWNRSGSCVFLTGMFEPCLYFYRKKFNLLFVPFTLKCKFGSCKYTSVHPPIFFFTTYPVESHKGAEAFSSCHWVKGGAHPGQVTSLLQGIPTHINAYRQHIVTN